MFEMYYLKFLSTLKNFISFRTFKAKNYRQVYCLLVCDAVQSDRAH